MEDLAPDAVVITGMGMATSLGHDAATCCAAARAGVVRSEEMDCFLVTSETDAGGIGVVGHAVSLLTRGFEGPVRILRILQAALEDLRKGMERAPWPKGGVPFYLSLPDPGRRFTGIQASPDEEREGLKEVGRPVGATTLYEEGTLSLLREAGGLARWPERASLGSVTTSGHAGIAEMLLRATADLRAGSTEMAVIGGADSLLDELTLLWLQKTGRLKTESVPVGVQPGEAAAFLLLELGRGAQKRGASILGVVRNACLGEEGQSFVSGNSPRGTGLATVIGAIAASSNWCKGRPAWLVTDQNGENYRSMDWGNAVVRLRDRSPAFESPVIWHPAASFGDTGAASGAVSLCVGIAALGRGYAPSPEAGVISSSDGAIRAAVLLSGPVS